MSKEAEPTLEQIAEQAWKLLDLPAKHDWDVILAALRLMNIETGLCVECGEPMDSPIMLDFGVGESND